MANKSRQVLLEELLKHKGIGPEGSKSLKQEQLIQVETCFLDPTVDLITKATMLTALLMLPANEAEQKWLDQLDVVYEKLVPAELYFLIEKEALSTWHRLLLKVVNHGDLSIDEADQAINYLLDEQVEDYLKAIFLEGERLKRETHEENVQFYSGFEREAIHAKLDCSAILSLCDSYDGCVRVNPYTLFTCSVLAALGHNVYVHSLDEVAPKKGVTMHQLLAEAGKRTDLTLAEACEEMEFNRWAYIDQAVYFPELFQLKYLREKMVKRPLLATFEKLLHPIRSAQGKNYAITSYTHKAYKLGLVHVVDEVNLFDKFLNVKGVEATSQPWLSKATEVVVLEDRQIREEAFEAFDQTIEKETEISVEVCLQNGIAALSGEKNYAYYQIMHQAKLCLTHFFGITLDEAQEQVEEVVLSKKALDAWRKGCE